MTRFHAGVFAVEPTAVQLCWRNAPAGPVDIELDRGHRRPCIAHSDAGPGSVVIDALTPSSTYRVTIAPTGGHGQQLRFTTLPDLGPELGRFATMSDIHIGARAFGALPRVTEPGRPSVPHPLRCARAAIAEWTEWGAQRAVLKGDLVEHGWGNEWEALQALLGTIPQPWHLMLGNHETMGRDREDPRQWLRTLGVPFTPVRAIDVAGLRLVLAETALDDRGHGAIHDPAAAIEAVAETDRPCMVLLHHHVQRWPIPLFWPPGIASGPGHRFLRDLKRANPSVLVVTGHSHRHRKRVVHGVPHIEVGSVKDYPGVWAGYVIHENGIRQVVRRVSSADCLRWTDLTRRVMFGTWRWFSPGRLAHRCFVHRWAN